jgi:hypothetical protein
MVLFTSFVYLADGKFLYGISGNQDGHLLLVAEEKTQNSLSYGYIAAGNDSANLRLFGNTDFQAVFHNLHLFPRASFSFALCLIATGGYGKGRFDKKISPPKKKSSTGVKTRALFAVFNEGIRKAGRLNLGKHGIRV